VPLAAREGLQVLMRLVSNKVALHRWTL